MKKATWIVALAAALLCAAGARAQGVADAQNRIVVAVLNFETGSKEISQYGEQIPDLLTVFLSAEPNYQLVERAKIKHVFEELALGATGIVDEATKARIGHMTGAKFLITGRAMVVGKQLYLTAKVMSTETSRVGAKMVKAGLDADLDESVRKLAAELTGYLAENAKAMQPRVMTEQEVIAQLQKQLNGVKLPVFAVVIGERHMSRPIPDPAAETEVAYILKSLGATLISVKDDAVNDWVRDFLKEAGKEVPKSLQPADIAIIGEAFSEYAATTEKLVSCKARLEIKAVDTRTGSILAIGRATATAVDLAENIAAKSALQKGAAEISVKLIPEAVTAWTTAQKTGERK